MRISVFALNPKTLHSPPPPKSRMPPPSSMWPALRTLRTLPPPSSMWPALRTCCLAHLATLRTAPHHQALQHALKSFLSALCAQASHAHTRTHTLLIAALLRTCSLTHMLYGKAVLLSLSTHTSPRKHAHPYAHTCTCTHTRSHMHSCLGCCPRSCSSSRGCPSSGYGLWSWCWRCLTSHAGKDIGLWEIATQTNCSLHQSRMRSHQGAGYRKTASVA